MPISTKAHLRSPIQDVQAGVLGQGVPITDRTLHPHAGAKGAGVHAYLDRHPHPQEVTYAVSFLEGLARWDFVAAARSADALLGTTIREGIRRNAKSGCRWLIRSR